MNESSTPAERYREAARRHGAATESGDYEAANAAYDRLIESLGELKKIPDGLRAIEVLLEDRDPNVRCWAATHLLPSSKAADVLEELSHESSIAAFNARQVLKEWKAGKLRGIDESN